VFILPPRTSWLYRYGMSLSPTRRYLLTLLFITLCSLVWVIYIYQPMQKRITKAQQLSKAPRTQSVAELEETIATIRQELSAQSLVPSGDDQLHAVLGYVDQAHLNLEHCAVQDKAIVLQGTGTFKQIQAFFDQLTASGQRLAPRDVRITRGVDNHFTLWASIETV
jgi:type II secretory pathway component PulM